MAQPAPLPPHHCPPNPPMLHRILMLTAFSCYLAHSNLQPVTCHSHTEGHHVSRASITTKGNFTFPWSNGAARHTHVGPHAPWAPPPTASASKDLAICPAYPSRFPANTQWSGQGPYGWQGTGSAWAGEGALLGFVPPWLWHNYCLASCMCASQGTNVMKQFRFRAQESRTAKFTG